MDHINGSDSMVNDAEDNYQSGYIKLYRSLNKHWVWQDAEKLKWWLDILLEVNHSDQKVLLGGLLIECKRGQSLYSLETWAKRWRVDEGRVRRFFKLLIADGMITTKNVKKSTLLTVCKYESYNNSRHSNDTQATRRRHDVDTQATPNKNDKKEKNDKNDKKGVFPPSLEDVRKYFEENGFSEFIADKAFKYYNDSNWFDSKGNKVVRWKQKMQSVWFKDENRVEKKVGKKLYTEINPEANQW